MKKIKRWLGGLCCAALLLALLTACGSQTPQQVQPDAAGTVHVAARPEAGIAERQAHRQ
jgi:ABC-type oligopeptide transport system substrate-binding subunit